MEKTLKFLKLLMDDNAEMSAYDDDPVKSLPLQLAGAFIFCRCSVLGYHFLALKPRTEIPYNRLKSMIERIEEVFETDAAVILDHASPYLVKKMLEERIAFIVPGKQISLPFMAVFLRNEKKAQREVRRFTPSAQLLFLYLLYSGASDVEINDAVRDLHISKMSASRGLNDLLSLGLLNYEIAGATGRKRVYSVIDRRQFWNTGKNYLDDPVLETVWIREIPQEVRLVKTGLTALAEQTMLAENAQSTYALCRKERSRLDQVIVSKDEAMIHDYPMVLLTRYDTGVFGTNGCADPISLKLCLSETDERIEIALEELLSEYEWYEKEEDFQQEW